MINITRHITDRQNIITSRLSIIMLCFSIITLSLLNITFLTGTILGIPISTTSALSYQSSTDVSFTFDPILSISVSPDSITTPTIAPGTTATSNIITVNVSTNTAYGYSLLASVGNNTQYNTSDLMHSDSTMGSTFTSIATNASLPQLDTDNTWGYSFSSNHGSTWSTYHGLPLYSAVGNNTETNNPALLIDTTSPADNRSVDFRIAARASSTQPSGTYSNVINFYAVGKPEPPPTSLTFVAGEHIDTLTVVDSSHMVWNPSYVTPEDANRSISFTSPSKGTRYLVVVAPEPGYVLSSDSTKSSYVQKFASGTLANNTLLTTIYTAGDAGDIITVSAAKISSDSTHSAYAPMQTLTAAQCPVTSSANPQGINVTDARDGKSYTVARFGNYCYMLSNLRLAGSTNTNTVTLSPDLSAVSSSFVMPNQDTWTSSSEDHFCEARMRYINGEYYYNWYAAKANPTTGQTSSISCATTTLDSASLGSICPANWGIPTYYELLPSTLWASGANLGGLGNYGYFISGHQSSRNTSYGYWWSSRRDDDYNAWTLRFSSGATRSQENKSYGRSVRCMLSN